jgi:hypothetical protein
MSMTRKDVEEALKLALASAKGTEIKAEELGIVNGLAVNVTIPVTERGIAGDIEHYRKECNEEIEDLILQYKPLIITALQERSNENGKTAEPGEVSVPSADGREATLDR